MNKSVFCTEDINYKKVAVNEGSDCFTSCDPSCDPSTTSDLKYADVCISVSPSPSSSSCYTKCSSSEEETSYTKCYTNKKCGPPVQCYTNPDICIFKSILTPLAELTPYNASKPEPIEFIMRRKNKTVSLQWEPYSATITTTGVAYLVLTQTLCNMPPYTVYGVYNLEYNGILRQAPVVIKPTNIKANILFYLNSDGSTNNVNANDHIIVKGGCVSWLVR